MKQRLLTLLSFLFVTTFAFGQTCLHKDLSTKLDFRTSLKKIKVEGSRMDSCIIKISIINKVTQKPVQTLTLTSSYLFDDVFTKCKSVRSYTTKKNINDEAPDNNYGDLIIADFNFDKLEDIAVKNDSGGNGGPLYTYYIQTKNRKFVMDKYLTEKMSYFPLEINASNKSLRTLVHANAYEMCETTFKIDKTTNKWRKINTRFVRY